MERELTRPLRLLIVNPSPVRGGAEELLLGFLEHHDPARVTPLVACLADGPFVDDLETTGARVRRFEAGRLRHPWAWARTVAELTPLARRADLVLSWQVKGHYYGTPAARAGRTPAVWWDHGIRPARGEPRYRIDNRLPASLKADLVICSSEAAAARHDNAVAIHPGIALDEFATPDRDGARALLGVQPDERVVAIVGRLQPWKGQHVFLRAAARIARADVRFLVIGGAPGGFSAGYPAELRALAASLGIEDRVRFLDQRDDVPLLLPGLDVFVHASFAEPFGIAVVEGMAAGVPVVASNDGGVPEIATDGEHAVLVTPGDDGALAGAIDRLLADPDAAASIAAAGRARAFERFGIDRCTREIEGVIEELVR